VTSYGVDSLGLEKGPVVGCCEHSNELSHSIRCMEFLEQLSNYQLISDSVLCN